VQETSAKARRGAQGAARLPYFQRMSATQPSSRLGLTTSEAARHLGVSLSTIRRWSNTGHLLGYRTPGGQRRFSVQQLDEFLASLEQGNTGQS
jgi:excisionase family DNA binding protein